MSAIKIASKHFKLDPVVFLRDVYRMIIRSPIKNEIDTVELEINIDVLK